MAVSHVGVAVLWGITTTGFNKNGTLITNSDKIRHASQSLGKTTNLMQHLSSLGETKGVTTWDQSSALSIECYPAQATVAAARTLRDALPAPGDVVRLLDSTDATSPVATDYICETSDYRFSNADKLIFSMSLKRWEAIESYDKITS